MKLSQNSNKPCTDVFIPQAGFENRSEFVWSIPQVDSEDRSLCGLTAKRVNLDNFHPTWWDQPGFNTSKTISFQNKLMPAQWNYTAFLTSHWTCQPFILSAKSLKTCHQLTDEGEHFVYSFLLLCHEKLAAKPHKRPLKSNIKFRTSN